jgi:hypothetical protein
MSSINPRRENQVTRNQGTRQIEALILLKQVVGAIIPAERWIDISVPSARLQATIEVFFEALPPFVEADFHGVTPNYSTSSSVIIEARAVGIRNPTQQLNALSGTSPATGLPAAALPFSWEVTTGIRDIRFRCGLLTVSRISDAAAVSGSWYLRARWEPSDSSMLDSELVEFFAKCQIAVAFAVDI